MCMLHRKGLNLIYMTMNVKNLFTPNNRVLKLQVCAYVTVVPKNKTKNVSNYAGTEIEKTNYEIHELYTLSNPHPHISKDEMVLEECNQ